MNPTAPAATARPEKQTRGGRSSERSSRRRGSAVESPGHADKGPQDPDRRQSQAGASGPSSETPPVDETDVLSMGGPDSLEDVEESDGDGIER